MKISRYNSAITEEFQPGSRGRILRNKMGVTKIRELEEYELGLYMKCEEDLLHSIVESQKLTVADIDRIHKLFLGSLYDWAGTYRNVNLMKGGFPFAPALNIPLLMLEFEQEVLALNTPCHGSEDNISDSLAKVHGEFILIHPYREGNGRTARLLSTLMAWQAGYPTLDFSFIGKRGKTFDEYIGAIHATLERNYEPLRKVMLRAMRLALRRFGGGV